MPEIWLNYGKTEVVLDIKAENLEQKIDVEGKTLSDSEIESKLDALDISKPLELVVLNTSKSVKKILSILFSKYEKNSLPKPSILTTRRNLSVIKNFMPEHDSVSEFSNLMDFKPNLVFVGEIIRIFPKAKFSIFRYLFSIPVKIFSPQRKNFDSIL